jgi:hypothetical protein
MELNMVEAIKVDDDKEVSKWKGEEEMDVGEDTYQ